MRLRDLGVTIGSLPTGEVNAITDVPGVRVGHTTLIEGERTRTGVTVILPGRDEPWREPVFAGAHRLNGNGEVTGLEWVRESGMLHSPVALTNTHSVGVVRDALVAHEAERRGGEIFWSLPVVGETWDGRLNDVNAMSVRAEHVRSAIARATGGPVLEGNVGGGTGMICHGFKGGIGTSSRRVGDWTVGVLVQANHGQRDRLTIDGIPVGRVAAAAERVATGEGSIIGVVGTDAPLLPMQCERLAQRVGLGVARCGGLGEHFSGDLFLCFATGNRGLPPNVPGGEATTVSVEMVGPAWMNPLFQAVVESTEEAIANALLQADSMTGCGFTAHALPPELVRADLG